MVQAARRGTPLRRVARQFGVALATVQYWLARARGQRLDRVDWADRPRGLPSPVNRTDAAREDRVVQLRQELRDSDLGEVGAAAIHREWLARGWPDPPALRTIGLILARRGALDGDRRVRRPPPPRGWYLPQLASRRAELDSFDSIEGLALQGGIQLEVLTGISLHGGLAAAWPHTTLTAKFVVRALLEHWRAGGLPDYAQFDNDPIFRGPDIYPDTIGRVTRVCLLLGVVPVFVPPRETGFQAAIESFNGLWQAKVWARFRHPDLPGLQAHSARYIAAHRRRAAARIEAAPPRRPFPRDARLNLQAHPRGRLIFLRRTNAQGEVELLGHRFVADPHWHNRLVRAEVDLAAQRIDFFSLRRRAPQEQPLLGQVPYVLPRRRFND